jgi:hypothetical protein
MRISRTKHFSAAVSWTPLNINLSSPAKFVGAQQLTLHMKFSKFQ